MSRLLLPSIWIAALIAILPVLFRWTPPAPLTGRAAHLQLDSGYAFGLLICYWIYRVEMRRLGRVRSLVLVFMVFLLTSITNGIHRYYIDHSSLSSQISNLNWQIAVQEGVMRLSSSFAPHSYRFLPNCIVRWMQLAGFSYENARDVYRLIVGLLVFYALYRYARLFAVYGGAILAMMLVALIYPISFEYYAGQLTDPLSQLSFILVFIFLETSSFGLFLSTLIIGSLAKETVLAMAGYYLLFGRAERHYFSKAALLVCAVVADYFGVRWLVLGGSASYRYSQVSGMTPADVRMNLHSGRWLPLLLLTVGSLIPFLLANWKDTPTGLKRQALFLFPVLLLSSIFFSWLFETRNFMPLVFVLAVAAGRYLSGILLRDEHCSPEPSCPTLTNSLGNAVFRIEGNGCRESNRLLIRTGDSYIAHASTLCNIRWLCNLCRPTLSRQTVGLALRRNPSPSLRLR